MRRSGREGCCPAAGLGRGECEQRVRRAAGRTLHRNEVVAEIRCAFAALCRAGALLVAALRGHTPLPPLRSLPLRRARVRTYLFGRVNPARRRGAPDSLRAPCPVAHRAWARAGTRNHRTHLFPGAGGWNERRSSRTRHAHEDAQRADFAPRRREIRIFPRIPRLEFSSFGSKHCARPQRRWPRQSSERAGRGSWSGGARDLATKSQNPCCPNTRVNLRRASVHSCSPRRSGTPACHAGAPCK